MARNVLLIMVDQWRWDLSPGLGNPLVSTPALDRLAFGGKRLTQWYSGYPVCTSSRTALMTGRQPARVGMPGVMCAPQTHSLWPFERWV